MNCKIYSILITGGSGFIGSHIIYLLLKMGFNIVSLDSYINSSPKVYKNILSLLKIEKTEVKKGYKFVEGDIKDKLLLKKIFNEQINNNKPIKAVIHLAGLKSVNESLKNSLNYWSNNVCGSINIFEVMKEFECNTIVFSSSATIYGLKNNSSIKEKSEIKPTNPYGKSKAVVESILNDLYSSSPNSWKIANLRYFNPIGAHPSGLLGENLNNSPNNIFPCILQVAMNKEKS